MPRSNSLYLFTFSYSDVNPTLQIVSDLFKLFNYYNIQETSTLGGRGGRVMGLNYNFIKIKIFYHYYYYYHYYIVKRKMAI